MIEKKSRNGTLGGSKAHSQKDRYSINRDQEEMFERADQKEPSEFGHFGPQHHFMTLAQPPVDNRLLSNLNGLMSSRNKSKQVLSASSGSRILTLKRNKGDSPGSIDSEHFKAN